ncbi:hypothetical protein CFAM422_002706 [Trichoderma lentiforme]|uniref:NACHT domain-containing protein n=1 Tax=Trichoderma lentiforme TaxID=1567552 RepID=A0A9P4XKY4_9HYPO|nr:hypothetical protein CFAM422_002706 [Trichoderma lentiforme]
MPPFWKKRKGKRLKEDISVQLSVEPDFPTVPNESVPNPEPAPNCEPDVEPKQLQGRLWNKAYEQLKSSNTELVESYEKILSTKLFRDQNGPSEPASLENRIDKAYNERWKQMQMIVEAALEKKQQSNEKKQKIGSGLAAVGTTMSQAVRAVPEGAVAWTGVCFALEMVSNSIQEAKANNEGILYVVSRMDWYWHLAELLSDDNRDRSAPNSLRLQMEKHIVDLAYVVTTADMDRPYGETRSRLMTGLVNWMIFGMPRRLFKKTREYSMLWRSKSVLEGLMLRVNISSAKKEEQCLKDLRVTDPRDDKSRIEDTNGGLLQGAYGWAIKHGDFIAWRDENANHMLWIKGDPGKGKTMLLCGIIDELQRQNIKPCYFFCQASDPRLNSATAVLRGLIYLLVDTNRQLLSHIQEKYDRAGAALFQDANSWVVLSQIFTKLLKDPSLDGQVFIIDALDECQKDLERLLDLVVERSIGSHAKWIVSSRNSTGIEEKLNTISQNIRFSLELNEHSVSEAVNHYITHKTARLKDVKRLDEETELIIRKYLTDNARGTFLWVALVCKELSKISVRKRHVLSKMAEFPSDLGPLYERMMQQIRASEDSDLCERILRLVSVLFRPITLTELASLLEVENKFDRDDLEEMVASCGSFLLVRDDSVRFVHQSAQDFLLRDKMFVSELGSQHYTVFSRSLDILSVTLRRDMYNLRYPGALIEEYTPSQDQDILRHAKYSCVYWVDHLKAVNDLEREKSMLSLRDNGIVHHFLKEKSLNWLEALSLMRKMPDAARVVRILKKLVEDIFRFVLSHKVGIELAPLQVYSSALIFSPSSSIIRRMYEGTEVPKWVITKPEMPVEWTARVQSLEGGSMLCQALEFSPDGAQIASADADRTVRIWDLETGMCLHILKCSCDTELLAFSPNGKHLATGSFTSVEIWDLSTSAHLFTLKSETSISSLAFSFDGTRFAASYSDEFIGSFIRTWDLATGIKLKTCKLPGIGMVECRCTAFAPDGTHLACVETKYHHRRIHIWNLTTDRHLPALEMTLNCFILISPVFSADAAQLAVPATDGTIHIFDTLTGACLLKLGQICGLPEIKFSAASTRLMTKSWPEDLRIWDSVTGECLRRFNVDWRRISAVSSDGMLAVSGFSEVEIWDMAIGGPMDVLGATIGGFVQASVFSPDGTQLAIASAYLGKDCVIKILDPDNGTCLKQFQYAQEKDIGSMVFFPDGKRLLSVGLWRIEIWSVSSGVSLQLIDLPDSWQRESSFHSLAVSSDGNHLAMIPTQDTVIKIMHLPSGNIIRSIAYGWRYTSDDWPCPSPVAMAFSPDGAELGLTLKSGFVEIYDVHTGAWLEDFVNFGGLIHDCQFTKLRLRTGLRIFGYQDYTKAPQTRHALMRRALSAFTVCEKGTWIMRGKQRVLWLPPEYRPSEVEVFDGFVTCRTDRGKFLCFQFAVDELDKVLA